MSKEFESCRKAGGKIRTKTIKGTNKYMHICIPPGGGKGSSVGGEVHTKKKVNPKKGRGH